jgi:hypothetical protein
MLELSPQQIKTVEKLFQAGFQAIAIPLYENSLCIKREECVAVLSAAEPTGLRLVSPPSLLVDGNISVRLKRGTGEVFVWKKKEIAATPERLAELKSFRKELTEILELPATQ